MSHRLACLFVGGVALVSTACSHASSPAAPSPAAVVSSTADFSGIWQGQYRITDCSGERDCWLRVGTARPFVLRLTQSGTLVTGILEAWSFVVEVGGEASRDGTVTLAGSRPGTSGYEGMAAVQVSLRGLRLDPQAGLSGSLSYTLDRSEHDWPFPHISHGGTVLSASRGRLPAVSPAALAAYEGTWTGTYVVESCTFSGWASCYPESSGGGYRFALTLRLDGAGLAGDLVLDLSSVAIPIAARVTNEGLVVEGSASQASGGNTSTSRIVAWATSRDIYDRLNGTFEYERTWSTEGGSPHWSKYQARLTGVTRQP